MTRFNNNRIDTANPKPVCNPDLDAYVVDDEFDDFLDREFLAIREFADFRNL